MGHFRRLMLVLVLALAGAGFCGGVGAAFAAAGAAPLGPIDPVKSGADLKLACGQRVEGFDQIAGEKMYRSMLIVQCRAVVGTIVELVAAGKYALNDMPIWQCVENREDHDALTVAFVQWVGRRPALLREPAAVAFIEAIEMSEKCRN
jgi:hypothetical protein